MRKFLIAVTTFALSMTVVLSGCSCNPKTPLSFTNNFSGGGGSTNDVSVGYSETLEYDVTYLSTYSDNNTTIEKDPLIDKLVTLNFSNGKYKSVLTLEPSYPNDLPKSDILAVNGGSYDKEIYHLKTEFSITASYEFKNGGEKKSFNDSIISEIYFANYGSSFAPIYSKTSVDYSLLYVSTEQAAASSIKYSYSTLYNTDSYTVEQSYFDEEQNKDVTEKKEFEYTYKTLIDNSELLFAIRNITVAKEASYSLPTVAPQYGEAKTLKITNLDENTAAVNFNYNGTEIKDNLQVRCLSFVIDSQKNSGMPQYVKIQNGTLDNLPQKALLVEYVETMVTYGTTSTVGMLKYTLKSVTVG